MYRVTIDKANGRAQLQVKNNCAGLTLIFKSAVGGVLSGEDYTDVISARVELVRRSQPNAVLFDRTISQLNDLWAAMGRNVKGMILPFAFKDSLLLSKDAYLQVDLSWPTDSDMNVAATLEVIENLLPTNTNIPISLKKVAIDGEMTVDSEHYEYVILENGITKIETFVNGYAKELNPTQTAQTKNKLSAVSNSVAVADLSRKSFASELDHKMAITRAEAQDLALTKTGDCGCDGQVKTQKVELDYNFMSFVSTLPVKNEVIMKTQPNQEIKFFGTGNIFLVQL